MFTISKPGFMITPKFNLRALIFESCFSYCDFCCLGDWSLHREPTTSVNVLICAFSLSRDVYHYTACHGVAPVTQLNESEFYLLILVVCYLSLEIIVCLLFVLVSRNFSIYMEPSLLDGLCFPLKFACLRNDVFLKGVYDMITSPSFVAFTLCLVNTVACQIAALACAEILWLYDR